MIRMIHNEELFPTINGWLKGKDLREGDILFDQRGRPCYVTAVRHIDSPLWKVTTKLEDTIRISMDQKLVNARPRRNTPTKQLPPKPLKELTKSHRIKNQQTIDNNPTDVPIDPYLFGLWFFYQNSVPNDPITVAVKDQFYNKAMKAINWSGFTVVDSYFKKLKGKNGKKHHRLKLDPPLWTKLNQHYYKRPDLIPDEYLYGSLEQRTELLESLFAAYRQTWGYCRDGHHYWVKFGNKKEQLSMQLAELARSCGHRIQLVMRDGHQHFLIPRFKTANFNTSIRTVEEYGTKPAVELKVNSPDGTFLVTENFIALCQN